MSEWTGRVWEDFTVGEVIYHPFGRTVTQADNQLFTLMTQNVAEDPPGRPRQRSGRSSADRWSELEPSTLALVTGQSTVDLSITWFANLGWDEVRTPRTRVRGRHHPLEVQGAVGSRVDVPARGRGC